MKILYFDFGEARIQYGSAASMKANNHEVLIVELDNLRDSTEILSRDVEIGSKHNPQCISVDILQKSVRTKGDKIFLFTNFSGMFEDIVSTFSPDVIITGSNYWFIAKKLSSNRGIPLIFWKTVVPSLIKLKPLVVYGKNYSKIFTSPVGLMCDLIQASLSDYTVTNDSLTTELFQSIGFNNIATLWPTYTRFTDKNAYKDFLEKRGDENDDQGFCSTNYVLSVITLERGSFAYNIELRGLDFIHRLARRLPGIDFAIIGSSLKDISNPTKYLSTPNLKFLGKIFSDTKMDQLYSNALCIYCPITVPGFSNRLLEAMYYGKVTISPPNIKRYYNGLIDEINVILLSNLDSICLKINKINLDNTYKQRIEDNCQKYYDEKFLPQVHRKQFEKICDLVSKREII